MMNKLLTIAIPTYNRKKYLNLSLDSIFSQIDERVEVIVSDNCSEDGTEEFIKKNYPQVIYYRNEKNVGMENFQRCYKRATSKFIWLLGDDDVITQGSLKYILDFLQNNPDLALLFLNHTSFQKKYEGIEHCTKPFFKTVIGDFVTTNKDKFISIAKYQLTFISCFIISHEKYLNIDNPDQYNNNWFLQSCIAFKVTSGINSKLGVISKICVAQNVVPTETEVKPTDFDIVVEVFGEAEKYVFDNLAVECGYNRRKMEKCHSEYLCSNWPKLILSYKAKGYAWKDAFWNRGFPIIKYYPKAWLMIIPVALVPDGIAKFARNIKQKLDGNSKGR